MSKNGNPLPFRAESYGVLNDDKTMWSSPNDKTVRLPVVAKKAYFATPCNVLPDTGNPYGSIWKQDLGQITYFTPGEKIAPAWVTTSIQFFTNFIKQKVKVIINNSKGFEPTIMHDWEMVSDKNELGSFQPKLEDTKLMNLEQNVNYWVEVWFDQSVNKTVTIATSTSAAVNESPQDEGFLAKYWWSITQAQVSDKYKTASKTDLSASQKGQQDHYSSK